MKHTQIEPWCLEQKSFSCGVAPERGFIGYLQVGLFIAQSRSLKDRRRVIERIKQKVKNKFNISVGEKPCQMWKNCELFFVCPSYTRRCALETADHLEEFLRSHNDIQIMTVDKGVM